jgi:transcription elongation factor Elf1
MTNPWFLAILNTLMHSKRKCPKCGREQIVSKDKRGETVRCKHCGADIPPPRKEPGHQ